jgi:hypothetical protein
MNSAHAEALRLILPLLLRLATVDFFGTDDFRERVEVFLGFDDVPRTVVEDRDEWAEDRPPFRATTVNGTRRATAARATPIRFNITILPVPVAHYQPFKKLRQVKAGR